MCEKTKNSADELLKSTFIFRRFILRFRKTCRIGCFFYAKNLVQLFDGEWFMSSKKRVALNFLGNPHQFVLNACEVQRFRRLSCFGSRASNCEGCASFPPSLAQAEDTLVEPPKSPRNRGNLPVSLCFVSHVTRVLFRSYGWHTVQKNSFSFGVRNRRETSPIQRLELKITQNVRLFNSHMPTAFPRQT